MSCSKKSIPNNLKKYRRLMKFSQLDISNKLNLSSVSIVSRWERGKNMPSAENLLKLSKLYKTLANELYFQLCRTYEKELFPKALETKKPVDKDMIKRSPRGP